MKRADAERAKQIINDWISYEDIQREIESIAYEGPPEAGTGTSAHPNPTLGKAERAERLNPTYEEKRAAVMISVFSDRVRAILTDYERWRNKPNPISKRPYTHDDIAIKLGMKKERYTALREHYAQVLVDADRMDRARRVLIVSRPESEPRTQHIAAQNETVRT
jgi:hypothetical protein